MVLRLSRLLAPFAFPHHLNGPNTAHICFFHSVGLINTSVVRPLYLSNHLRNCQTQIELNPVFFAQLWKIGDNPSIFPFSFKCAWLRFDSIREISEDIEIRLRSYVGQELANSLLVNEGDQI